MENIRSFRSAAAAAAALVLACLLAGKALAVEPEDQFGDPFFKQGGAEPGSIPKPSEVESGISALGQPIDIGKLGWIRSAIMQQPVEEQERLQKALDAKLDEAFKAQEDPGSALSGAKLSGEPPVETGSSFADAEFSSQEIKMRIDMLNLYPDATADDLRQRNELMGKVSAITDPNIRYELLQYLDKKEKEAEKI